MWKPLIVGRIEDAHAADAAVTVAKELGAVPTTWFGRVQKDRVPWLNCPQTISEWECCDDATVGAFLDHAAEVEGLPSERRIDNSEWPHLPDYQEMYWLPLDFDARRIFKSSDPGRSSDGWPIAIASAAALLRNLEALKAASPLGLGERPAGPKPNSAMPLEDVVRWIWCCLHDGASTALANNAPLAIFP